MLVTIVLIAGGYAAAVLFFISLGVMAKRGDRAQELQLRLDYPPSAGGRSISKVRRRPAMWARRSASGCDPARSGKLSRLRPPFTSH